TRRRCRRKNGRAKGDHQSCCAATTSINRFRSRSLLFAFLSGSGARSSGERVRPSGYRRASLARAFASRIEITSSPKAARKKGFLSNGQKGGTSPPNTGFQRCRKRSLSEG